MNRHVLLPILTDQKLEVTFDGDFGQNMELVAEARPIQLRVLMPEEKHLCRPAGILVEQYFQKLVKILKSLIQQPFLLILVALTAIEQERFRDGLKLL